MTSITTPIRVGVGLSGLGWPIRSAGARVIELVSLAARRATSGGNRERVLFDLGVSVGALAAALVFRRLFIPVIPALGRDPLPVIALPVLFVTAAALAGLYTRLKLAPSTTKAAWLALVVMSSGVLFLAAGGDPALTTLWALLTLPSVALARVFLGLPFSEHPFVARITVPRHGPVVVVGGAGYIGSQTVELLLRRGYRVRVLDRLMCGRESLSAFAGQDNFELIEGDVTDISKLTAAAHNASAIIHLAGLVGDPACAVDPEFTRHANIVATRLAKEVAQGLGVQRFIFASSCSVYGASEHEMREGDELNPVSLYAQSKIDSERELLNAARDGLAVTILRFATVFGHSRRPRFDLVTNLLAAQAIAEGEITVIGPTQWRPFIHVRDLARAIVMVLEAEPEVVQGQIYNVGDDRLNMTIGQLGELVCRVVGPSRAVRLTVRDNGQDRRNYRVCFDKIRAELGFRAAITVEDGVREVVEHCHRGAYRHFRDPAYHNLALTRAALRKFYDPAELALLYAPLRVPRGRSRSSAGHRSPIAPVKLGVPAELEAAAAVASGVPRLGARAARMEAHRGGPFAKPEGQA